MTRPYAEVIGDPIAHSKSPLIHNFWLQKLGIDAEYRACHVQAEELEDYFARRREDAKWLGCNVTAPHKVRVIALIDPLAPTAVDAGAANTVARNEAGSLIGFNTDIDGVAEPLLDVKIQSYPNLVAVYGQIIGAGGAARAARLGLAAAKAVSDVDVFVRSPEKAGDFAGWAGTPFGQAQPLNHLGPIRNPGDGLEDQRYSHVIVNATSMGMNGHNSVPVDLSLYYPDTIVFDMVYAPVVTPLLDQARQLNLRTIDGLQMLVAQAAAAFELFFDQRAPREYDSELRALLTR